jgi:hypothetical protein
MLKEKPVLKTIEARGQRLMDGLSQILTKRGLSTA